MGAKGLHFVATLAGCVLLAACSPDEARKPAPPAKVETIGHETELLKIVLTPAAEQRLGIQTVPATMGKSAQSLAVHGEIVVPTGSGGAPITSQTDLATLAADQARADGEISRARAELEVAQTAATRAAALVREESGSRRANDEAQAAAAIAQANLQTAQVQRALLGSALSALGREGALWVRVATLASDVARIDTRAAATIRSLDNRGSAVAGRPVNAPPSANAVAGTIDLFYAIQNRDRTFRLGQRVAVDLPVSGASSALQVPASAVLRDIYGGEWVYVRSADNTYERRRIEVGPIREEQALLFRGLSPGDQVVTAGAAELFGTEFGSK